MDDSLLLNESVLSRDILLNSILPHLDLHALINFSSASRSCHRLVFRETPPSRWRTIQFQRRPPRSRRRHGSKISENAEYNICNITDDQLTSFVTNINARETTQLISLMGCPRLRGRGLTPLDGSNVLESIDLRVAGPKRQGNVDVNAVVSLLRRMLPAEEEGMVRLLAPSMSGSGVGIGSSRSSSANGISSSSSLGERPIGVDILEKVNKYYTPFSLQRVVFPPGCETLGIVRYFHQCHQFWNCVRDRFDAVGKSCSKCQVYFGNDISAWRCRVCGEYSCYPTKHHNHLDDDDNDDDDDDDENPPTEPCRSPTHCRRCHSCHDTFCSKEDEHHDACFACPVCQTWFCESCALPPVCSECPVRKCIWCSNLVECAACEKESCANHGFEGCDCCDRVFCEDCRQNELGVCVVCNRLYCSVSCHDGAH